jgi:hypothetical protein
VDFSSSVGMTPHSNDSLSVTVCWFDTAFSDGPAYGDPERTTLGAFTSMLGERREGEKDGPCFAAARFTLEPGGRRARRLKANLQARTMVALDIETNKKTGEVPPSLAAVADRSKALGLAAIGYTSHTNKPGDIRYRLVFPLSAEIPHELPAPEVMAELLGVLGVLDMSKIGAASLFYLPSCPPGMLDLHQTVVIPGAPIMAEWITETAGTLLAARQAEADRIADEARAAAAARREAKIAAGFNPDDSLIEKLRTRLDLDSVLTGHGYDKQGTKYRHPNSSSGSYGADIKTFGGIERVFSHNATDLLHASNLPAWCDGVTALDAVDATIILDFGGDRTRALRELAERFNLTKSAERKALAGLLFRMVRRRASQGEIEVAAFAEGERVGLSREDVCNTARWVISQLTANRDAA